MKLLSNGLSVSGSLPSRLCPVPAVLDRFTLDLDRWMRAHRIPLPCAPLRPMSSPGVACSGASMSGATRARRTSTGRPNGSRRRVPGANRTHGAPEGRLAGSTTFSVCWPPCSNASRHPRPISADDADGGCTACTHRPPLLGALVLAECRAAAKEVECRGGGQATSKQHCGRFGADPYSNEDATFFCAASDVSVPHSFVSLARRPGTSPETRGRRSL